MIKPVSEQAWAVVGNRGSLILVDGRLPLFWLRRTAVMFAKEHGLRNVRVRKVVVNEIFGR